MKNDIRCDECEKKGLVLNSLIDAQKQISLNKKRGALIEYSNSLRLQCELENKYFIIECETQQQLNSKSSKVTRFQCNHKHNFFQDKKRDYSDELPNL